MIENVTTLDELYQIENPVDHQVYYVEETGAEYIYDNGWEQLNVQELVNSEDCQNQIDLYQINKMLVTQIPPLTKKQIKDKQKMIDEYIKEDYYMFLCKDYNYYTVFVRQLKCAELFSAEFIDIVMNLGNVHSIEINDDNVIEVWITPTGESEPYVFFLFPYTEGVVYYE